MVAFIDAVFPLRNNPFQIVPADFFEQQLSIFFNMLGVDYSRGFVFPNEFAKVLLSFDQWEIPQVFVIQPQQIERIENRMTTSGEQFVELAYAIAIDTDNLAIQYRTVNLQFAD